MARRANKNASGVVTVRTVNTGYHMFEGRAVESVEEEEGYLVVSKKAPRRSKFVKFRYPMSAVAHYSVGEGGKGGSHAFVWCTEDIGMPITGEIALYDGYFTITPEGGEPVTFMDRSPDDPVQYIITEDSDGSGAPKKKKGKKAAPAKRSRRVVDEDDEDEEDADDEGDDEDEEDADDEGDDEDEEDDEEEEAPRSRRKTKKTVVKPAAKSSKARPAAAKSKRKVAGW